MPIPKPTLDDARWAETAGGTPSANLTAPTSGKKDVGWANGEQPDANQENWVLHQGYLWFKWLDAISNPNGHSLESVVSWYVDNQIIAGSYVTVGTDLTVSRDLFLTRNRYVHDPGGATTLGAGRQDDYALPNGEHVRLIGNGIPYSQLSGIAGGASGGYGRRVTLTNTAANGIDLLHQDTHSAAGNRIICPTGATITLAQDQSCTLLYDVTSARWRFESKNF